MSCTLNICDIQSGSCRPPVDKFNFLFLKIFVLLSLFLKINLMEFPTGSQVRGYLKKHELLSSGHTTGKKSPPP